MNIVSRTDTISNDRSGRRKGAVLVMAALLMVAMLAFAAFAIDFGYITLTKTQLQAAADASAMGAAAELADGLGPLGIASGVVEAAARSAAVEIAASNRTSDNDSNYLDRSRDVRLGQVLWDANTNSYLFNWGVSPFNAVETTLIRSQGGGDGDGPLNLFFAPVIGHDTANIQVRAIAGLLAGTGFRPRPGVNAPLLPIAYDLESWELWQTGDLGVGEDNFSYDPKTGELKAGSDGVMEIDLYPGSPGLPSGNRGALLFDPPGAKTLERQIRDGLSDRDLANYGGVLDYSGGAISVGGNTGLKASVREALNDIKGQTVALPIFSAVSEDGGSNAVYTIVQFVPVRIMYVELTGGNKRVIAQPAGTIIHETVIPGGSVADSGLFTPVRLLQ